MTLNELNSLEAEIKDKRSSVIENINNKFGTDLKYREMKIEAVRDANEIFDTSLRLIKQEIEKLKK